MVFHMNGNFDKASRIFGGILHPILPTMLRYPLMGAHTGMKFANLMREVAYKHDGAFIAVRIN